MNEKFKRAWKSFTIWVNGLALAAMPTIEYARDNIEQVREYINADFYKGVALVLVVTNLVLRFKTKKDLADK